MVLYSYYQGNEGKHYIKQSNIIVPTHNIDEINLIRGEYVTIVDQLKDDGWWKGTNERGETGLFPSNHVEVLKQEMAPPRPPRARPPTIKIESASTVPTVGRPASLLANRNSNVSNSSLSPPPRPTTLPPMPTNSSQSSSHKRIPSVPLLSPDLPPTSPVHERLPIIRPRAEQKNYQEALQHMATPPKINNLAPPSSSKPRTAGTVALDSSLVIEINRLILKETKNIRREFERKLETERIERLKLHLELEELKRNHLYDN